MTCAQIEGLLTRYMLGDLDPADLARVEEHLAACPTCRVAVAELRPTVGLLRQALAAPSTEALKLDPARRARVFASYGQRKPQIAILQMVLKAAAVIAILLMFAGLFLPAFTKCKESSRVTAAIARERQLTYAARAFESDHERKPQSASDLSGYFEDNGLTDAEVKRIAETPQPSSQTSEREGQMNFLAIRSKSSPASGLARSLGKLFEGTTDKDKSESAGRKVAGNSPAFAARGDARPPESQENLGSIGGDASFKMNLMGQSPRAVPPQENAPQRIAVDSMQSFASAPVEKPVLKPEPAKPESGLPGDAGGGGGQTRGNDHSWSSLGVADNGGARPTSVKTPTAHGTATSGESPDRSLDEKSAIGTSYYSQNKDGKLSASSTALGEITSGGSALAAPPAAAATPAPFNGEVGTVSRSRGGRVAAGTVGVAPGPASDDVQTYSLWAGAPETGLKTTDGRISGAEGEKDKVAQIEQRQWGLSATAPEPPPAPVVSAPVMKGLAANRTYYSRAPAKAKARESTALRSDLRDADGDGMADQWETGGGKEAQFGYDPYVPGDLNGRRASHEAQTLAVVGGTVTLTQSGRAQAANSAAAPVALGRLEKSIEPLQEVIAGQDLAMAVPEAKPDGTRMIRAGGNLGPSLKEMRKELQPVAMDAQKMAADEPVAMMAQAQQVGQVQERLASMAEEKAEKQVDQVQDRLESKVEAKAEMQVEVAQQDMACQVTAAKPLEQAAAKDDASKNAATLNKLDKTIIPELEFRQANIHDIVAFLNKANVEADKPTTDPAKKGVNIVLNLGDTEQQANEKSDVLQAGEKKEPAVPEVTFTARYITLSSALKIITQVSGLKYRIEDGIVFIEPRDKQEALQKVETTEAPPETTESTEPIVEPVYPPQVFNPIVESKENAFSTFGLDVDTASFTLARRYLLQGKRPPEGAIRVEEFVNAFEYAYRAPERDTFAVYADRARSPFRPSLDVLRIAVRGKVIGRDRMKPSVLTFVIDTSGSMNTPDRLDLIRKSLVMLVDHLAPQDSATIVAFGSEARLVLDQTKASHKDAIRAAINGLQTAGSTHLEAGMRLGYQMAARNFASGAINRVLLMSDGVANLGAATADEILAQVERYRKQGIYCSVFGVGQGTYNDTMLGTLADKGDGVYRFVDSPAEAKRVFVDELAATLCTIAKDVKIQVQFDPERVTRYRQLGYEKRHLEKEQFRDDTVDAGEVGAGQSATALYEVAVAGNSAEPLGTVRLRWKDADTGQVEERAIPIKADDHYASFEGAPVRFRLAAGVAEFADLLRRNPNTAGTIVRDVAGVIRPVGLELNLDQQVQALVRMVNAVRE